MRLYTPEISWHEREAINSLDYQHKYKDFPRLGTVAVDGAARIWKVNISEIGKVDIEYLSTIRKDCGALNTIRFSPDGEYVAFCGVSAVIYIGHQSIIEIKTAGFGQIESDKETWISRKSLRGHLYDIQSLQWSTDSQRIVSGSIDNTFIVWNVTKGEPINVVRDSRGYVMGVAFDPCGQFIVSIGNDRVLRVYNTKFKMINSVYNYVNDDLTKRRLWCDESHCSLFRRLEFSNDGQLLVVPSGSAQHTNKREPQFASYIFSRNNFARPILQLPHFSVPTWVVRFNPKLYKLRQSDALGNTPYRLIFAVASVNDVLLYDTEQTTPFAYVGDFHCTPLSDLSWSPDGRILAVSSTDGFISFVEFGEDELGSEYSVIIDEDTEETVISQPKRRKFELSFQSSDD